MKSKLIPIAYTVCVLKPNLALKADKVTEVLQTLEQEDFEVFHRKQKTLKNEEVLNLYHRHKAQEYYKDIWEYNMSGDSLVLLLINKVDSKFDPETNEDIILEDPITRLKKLMGPMDPEKARAEAPDSLWAKYGTDLIWNAFFASDDAKSANKERDVFKMSIPEKVPEFKYERYKVTLEDLFKFIFPPNLEHSDSTGRLDLFALYGPTVAYFSVDKSFCSKCVKIAKHQLWESIADEEAEEAKRMGQTTTSLSQAAQKTLESFSGLMGNPSSKKQVSKLGPGPRRLLREEDVDLIREELCERCQDHVSNYRNLTCGREGQHVMADIEIKALIEEINKADLLEMLKIEKGTTAKIMIETIDLHTPDEIMYTRDHIAVLLQDLETDYYERYEFSDMQKMILEDRRLRINYWTSIITGKPIQKFKNPNLLNKNPKVKRDDIKNPYFTLSRILPISLQLKKQSVREDPEEAIDTLHFDHKFTDMLQNEQDMALQRTIAKEFHRVAGVQDQHDKKVATNALLLRNYNDGKHGKWDNYSTLKGQCKGSYVSKVKSTYPQH